MEGVIDVNEVLDCVVFQIDATQNKFDTVVCSKGKTENLVSGHLDQLSLHLPEARLFHAKNENDSFKLQLTEADNGLSWFTKFTVARFLHLVNVPEVLKKVNAIENEISQLEDTKRFHLALYTKDLPNLSGVPADTSCLKEVGFTPKIKVETASSDATKNELLRAMDVRLMALGEELSSTFNKATGGTCSNKQISDLAAFCQHFGATELRDYLFKYLEVNPKELASNPSNEQSAFSHDSINSGGRTTDGISQLVSQTDVVKSVRTGISPAKIAEAERQSSSESGGSSDASDEDRPSVERSRPVIRSASPRRSASPMRRIQIGRSGSRRSTAITIKSLNYFPGRERTSYNRDADGNSCGDEESNQPPKKPENTVRRMSVQDAISLFESKQKDQVLDIQKRRAFGEVSVSTNKSVLRRWSAGMGDTSSQCRHENSSESGFLSTSNDVILGTEEKNATEVKAEPDIYMGNPSPVEDSDVRVSLTEEKTSIPIDCPIDLVVPKAEETQEKPTDAAEWTRQKEAELNQMMMRMMESKPSKYRSTTAGIGGNQEPSGEQKGGFYRQYKEKRDEKLRAETTRKRAEKEAQFKVMQETLDQRKAEMAKKTLGVTGKLDLSTNSQKSRRNSSPPVLPKRESPKSTGPRKVSAKTSSSLPPATRSSYPLTLSPRTTGTPPAKTSTGTIATSTTPNRRKPQATPSPTRPTLKTEGPLRQPKGTKGTQRESKPALQIQEEKKQKVVTKSSRSAKTTTLSPSGDESGATKAKPSFYNKVTKKNSVVPLESKPFLRKGTGIGSGVGPVLAKTKPQSDDTSKNSGNHIQTEEKESVSVTAETISQLPEEDLVQETHVEDASFKDTVSTVLNHANPEISDPNVTEVDSSVVQSVEFPILEIQPDEDLGISSAAWVEVDQQELPDSCNNGLPQIAIPAEIAPVPSSSPRIRHSLSQMLQADNSEPEIIEWGNAENPPALVYQKDAPKGLKRLLKFARKSKGEANVAGWSSPSVFSEGEEDAEEFKAGGRRNADVISRKAASQTKGFGQQKTVFYASYDGGNSSKRTMDSAAHEILSAQSSTSNFSSLNSHKLGEAHLSTVATSNKGTRSFFSLSTFRSSKSSETKLR